MKILNYLKSAKGILIRLSLIICLGFCLNFQSYNNPIQIPPQILEIYFNTEGWSIELVISEYYGGSNLDNMRIRGRYDTALFVQGIEYTPGEVYIITLADLQTNFYIDQSGDCLFLEDHMGDYWVEMDYFGLRFGVLPAYLESEVSAPVGDESIAYQLFVYPVYYDYYWAVKESPNTIGFNPFQVSKRASFSGYVKDKNNDALPGIKLYYCPPEYHYATTPTLPEIFTDVNGYFICDYMFCKKYTINFLHEGGEIGDTVIFIEPDSANYFEFRLDTLLTGIGEYKPSITSYSIYNIPNPILNQTSFVVETSGYRQFQKGVIKIYSSEGYIVDILPIEISGERQEVAYNLTDKALASGIYYYSLEIGKEKKATGKMVISR